MFGLCDMAKWLYVFKDPMGHPDVKIGITGHPKSRLGTYQNAMSPRSHRACFDFVWCSYYWDSLDVPNFILLEVLPESYS